jgi:transposase
VTELEVALATIKLQALQIAKLTQELLILKRRLFGRSSEAAELLQVQGQLFAPPETVERDATTPAPPLPRTPKTTAVQPRQQPKREVIPEGLPREICLVDLPDDVKAGLVEIGTDTSERLAYKPAEYYVIRTIRPRYADPRNPDTGVQQMPVPPSVIPGGILDISVLTEIAISKFADHMPLSRQIDRRKCRTPTPQKNLTQL